MIGKIAPFVKKYKKFAVITPFLVAAEVILEVLIPLLMAKIVDVGIEQQDLRYVLRTGGFMILMALCSLFCGAAAGRTAAVAATGFACELRKALFDKVQEFAFANLDRFSTASLITRMTTDVTNTQNMAQMMLRILIRAPLMLVCAVCMAAYINARLTRIFLLAAVFLIIGIFLIMRLSYPRFRRMMEQYDGLNSRVQENLTAIRTVKAYVREPHENQAFRDAAEKLCTAQRRAEKLGVLAMPMMSLILYSCIVAICWFGGNFIVAGTMKTGELISFISYTSQIMISLIMVAVTMLNLVLSRASAARIIEVLEEEPEMEDPKELSAESKVPDGSVRFDNVSFSYSGDKDRLVLKNVSFSVASGETVGIVGGTGSSKTSLVQLIPRLYDVLEGRVLVGGRDVKEYPLQALRDSVAVVLQKNLLFSGTIEENLKWGNPEASEEEIAEACEAAAAREFIEALPDGYKTDLGQGGVNVSGGQKQRLCIARALLKKPKIIILDDSTSAVDTATDAKIRRALRQRLSGMTTILIAQRLSSVQDADRIIVLEDGQISGIGTHEELLRDNEIYREIYRSQSRIEEVG